MEKVAAEQQAEARLKEIDDLRSEKKNAIAQVG